MRVDLRLSRLILFRTYLEDRSERTEHMRVVHPDFHILICSEMSQ